MFVFALVFAYLLQPNKVLLSEIAAVRECLTWLGGKKAFARIVDFTRAFC